MECDEEDIKESSRTSGERFKENLKALLSIFDHYYTPDHTIIVDSFSITGTEVQNITRTIKEATYPSLNKNIGKYHLPHIWDEILFNTPELKLK